MTDSGSKNYESNGDFMFILKGVLYLGSKQVHTTVFTDQYCLRTLGGYIVKLRRQYQHWNVTDVN